MRNAIPPNIPPTVDPKKLPDLPREIGEVSTPLCKTVTEWITVVVVGEYDSHRTGCGQSGQDQRTILYVTLFLKVVWYREGDDIFEVHSVSRTSSASKVGDVLGV